jgi:hypothetical protein
MRRLEPLSGDPDHAGVYVHELWHFPYRLPVLCSNVDIVVHAF